MSMFSSNPTLSSDVFKNFDYTTERSTTMTVSGAAIKTMVLLGLAIATAAVTWNEISQGANVFPWLIGSSLGGLVVAMITFFKPTVAPFTAPVYAALEGVVLGALSAFAESRFPGIAAQAMMTTFGVTGVMLFLYTSRTIQVTPRLYKFLGAAIMGIMLTYLLSFVLGMFGIKMPFLHEASPIGLAISLFICGIAAFTLLLDFHQIEEGAKYGAPKSMEWYCAFGLMVTLVWLYIEILRMLMIVQSLVNGND